MGKQTERQNQMETQINDPVTVSVLHRNNEDEYGRIIGDCWELTNLFNFRNADYTPSWKEVYSYEVENTSIGSEVDGPHEDCFRINNAVDGTDKEMPVKFQTRSLSVGDLVVLSHPSSHYMNRNSNRIPEFYFVDSFGWVKLTEKDFVYKISSNGDEIQLNPKQYPTMAMAEGRS
jgi:hypothetical protein